MPISWQCLYRGNAYTRDTCRRVSPTVELLLLILLFFVLLVWFLNGRAYHPNIKSSTYEVKQNKTNDKTKAERERTCVKYSPFTKDD